MSWPTQKLEAVADFCLGKMLDQKKNRGEPLPYLANVNVRWGEFDLADLREMRFEQHELDRYGLKYGDIVMCEGGEPGRCAIWKEQCSSMMIQKALHRIRPHDCLRPEFLYYFFLHKGRTGHLASLFTGSTIKHLPREKLALVEVPVLPHSTQDQIASVLSAYDDLIENNRRRIQLLEQAARLLFKEWFVHLRFPGHEHTQIIDGVPEGWEKKPLSEIADITMGQSPKSIYYNQDGNGLPFHQGVTNFGVRFPSHETYCTVQSRIAEPGDILFSVRAPVGRINITPDKIVIGRGLAAIRSNCDQPNYLFYALKSHFFKEDMIGGGAIFAAITKKDLYGVELMQPTDRIATMFMEHVLPIDLQIANLQQTIERLAKARDLLLPKLMNGEVPV
ncbi:Restriction modification system DNA specificity domain-containing protein [uncultured Desulfatiglans sp.]|nr:Restriction modification system DNA specificity domain-containing protein [uncultured Desulfatiglans sp.]